MKSLIAHQSQVSVYRNGSFSRRDWLWTLGAGMLAAGSVGWRDALSLHAEELKQRGMSCILLWMAGGPSQLETLDPKPGHANGGETKAIETKVPGIQIAEHLPKLAQVADKLTIVRSMTTREGDHQRGSYLMHTANLPLGGLQYPTMGSVAAKEIAHADCELPAFVRIGVNGVFGANGGFLGSRYDAFAVNTGGRVPDNSRIPVETARFNQRLGLMSRLVEARDGASVEPGGHQKLYQSAAQMILSPQMNAFDLTLASDVERDAYGRGQFGSACLLARRLIESGVTFVEATLPQWDTHDNNFERSKALCEQLDQPYAHLLTDLADRGLLEKTLVVWMGEFGRTPRINPRSGRDHYPRAFSVALAGGGIRGGQVIGATDEGGESVKDRPVTEKDLFQSLYHTLGINTKKELITPIGRPIKYVEGGSVVDELFA